MPQGYDDPTKAAAADKFFRWIYLAKFEFDSAPIYVHNGVGTYTFESNEYLGLGEFGQIEPLKEGGGLRPYGVTFSLSGIDSTYKESGIDFYSVVDGEDIFNRKVTLYLGAIGATGAIIGTPRERFVGYMERPTINRGKNNVVQIRAENELINFGRRNGARYTDSDLQSEHTGDLGFQYLARVIDAKVIWRGRVSNIGGTTNPVDLVDLGGIGGLYL